MESKGNPAGQMQILENVTPAEANGIIQSNKENPSFILLDVRTPLEFSAGNIQGAINLDFYSSTFQDDLNRLDKNDTYLIYCRSGNRSTQALQIMSTLGFLEVYNLTGGIVQWEKDVFPTS